MTERGALLGNRYELDQIIGRGGMAEVWRARDVRLERDVAVKRLRVDLASDPTFQARFRREAQSAAGLNHPNIVAVYDTGEQMDPVSQVSVPYIVMELVEGITLREVLRGGRKLVPERALEFTAGVLDALAYSHRAGIIHRDIKPANVLVAETGAKLTDFGIARSVDRTSHTMDGQVLGTAHYLSPEQALGEQVGPPSDIYGLGVLAHEMLSGTKPFDRGSPIATALAHVQDAPPPLADGTPAELERLINSCLEKAPEDRPTAAALAELLAGSGVAVDVPAELPAEAPDVEETLVFSSVPRRALAER